MYAVIQTGGKQYKVEKGMVLEVEKLPVETDKKYTFEHVLLVVDGKSEPMVGQPYVAGAVVKANILAQDKDEKVVIFKYKRKTGYQRKTGHRQPLTRLQIEDITISKPKPVASEEKVSTVEETLVPEKQESASKPKTTTQKNVSEAKPKAAEKENV